MNQILISCIYKDLEKIIKSHFLFQFSTGKEFLFQKPKNMYNICVKIHIKYKGIVLHKEITFRKENHLWGKKETFLVNIFPTKLNCG